MAVLILSASSYFCIAMRFGKNLQKSIYEPWRSHYIDYAKLKTLLREEDVVDGNAARSWTEEDEQRFVDELVNVQLEKVNSFQVDTYQRLRESTSQCEAELEQFLAIRKDKDEPGDGEDSQEKEDRLGKVLAELDGISKEINELEKFSRLNFTGALKAAKKHDRRRGSNYKVRPLLQVRLASLPSNSEDYSPLLYRISAMYAFIRQNSEGKMERALSVSEMEIGGGKYTSYKCKHDVSYIIVLTDCGIVFVHPENLLEVKTYVSRHLPVLVYNPNTVKIADGSQSDPTITSLYFDDPKFSLYNSKVEKGSGTSLRIRWYGQWTDKPDLVIEKKTLCEGDDSDEVRVNIKDKYVMPFIRGKYNMEKSIQKLQDRKGEDAQEAQDLRKSANEIQKFLQENDLQPILRANYTRTAFQIPGEDRVRVSVDTNLILIREDNLDGDRPCRDPEEWHRKDIDSAKMEFPFSNIRKGEISRCPYAVLEIKVREGLKRKMPEWVEELMSSHLVKETPRFSKFVHGVASLFEDRINTFPFWMSLMDTDIRRDPKQAFEEEQKKKAKQAEDEIAVGSLIGSMPKHSFKQAFGSPAGRTADSAATSSGHKIISGGFEDSQSELNGNDRETAEESGSSSETAAGLRARFPAFSTSKYARAKRSRMQLPPGVKDPGVWIKDSGPVHVEPKVWLANQRFTVLFFRLAVYLP